MRPQPQPTSSTLASVARPHTETISATIASPLRANSAASENGPTRMRRLSGGSGSAVGGFDTSELIGLPSWRQVTGHPCHFQDHVGVIMTVLHAPHGRQHRLGE